MPEAAFSLTPKFLPSISMELFRLEKPEGLSLTRKTRERLTLSSQSASSEASPEFGHFPVCVEIALRTIAAVWPFHPRPKGEQRIAQGFSPGKPDAQRNRPERASEQGIGLQRNTQENVQTALFARRAMGTCTRKCPNASGRLGPPPLFELRRVREPSKVAP